VYLLWEGKFFPSLLKLIEGIGEGLQKGGIPVEEENMYCENCGKRLKPGVNFCSNCGYNLKANISVPPPIEPTIKKKVIKPIQKMPTWMLVVQVILGIALVVCFCLNWSGNDNGFSFVSHGSGSYDAYEQGTYHEQDPGIFFTAFFCNFAFLVFLAGLGTFLNFTQSRAALLGTVLLTGVALLDLVGLAVTAGVDDWIYHELISSGFQGVESLSLSFWIDICGTFVLFIILIVALRKFRGIYELHCVKCDACVGKGDPFCAKCGAQLILPPNVPSQIVNQGSTQIAPMVASTVGGVIQPVHSPGYRISKWLIIPGLIVIVCFFLSWVSGESFSGMDAFVHSTDIMNAASEAGQYTSYLGGYASQMTGSIFFLGLMMFLFIFIPLSGVSTLLSLTNKRWAVLLTNWLSVGATVGLVGFMVQMGRGADALSYIGVSSGGAANIVGFPFWMCLLGEVAILVGGTVDLQKNKVPKRIYR
jgi:hypothetical protein